MKAWEANIRKVVPYVPGDQPKGEQIIKLNTNENPYPPAPGVADIINTMDYEAFRKYPDPAVSGLVRAIAENYSVKSSQVFVGVGSDDVIAMAFQTFFNSDKPILFPDVSYSFYPVWAELFRIPYELKFLDNNFKIVKEDYYMENGGIIFPNPNAPTGIFMPLDEVEDIISHNQDVVIIIDEAYIDFGGQSALELVGKYENVLIVQTFSKSRSMAGMRIGFAIGSEELIKALNDVKYSFNSYTMNMTSIALGIAAVKDKTYFKQTIEKIVKTRESAKIRLKELGFSIPDSMANFVFAAHKEKKAEDIYEYLKKKQIYVRYFKKPRLDNYLRITIGTDEEMETLFQALESYL